MTHEFKWQQIAHINIINNITMNKNVIITIFTPTFNRAYIIENLYKSLCKQTNKKFEWLIVDDGSTDDTETLIKSFIDSNKIDIKYVKQVNAGKHVAINRGVDLARGELFFIVDSDDYLSIDAVEILLNNYNHTKHRDDIGGVSCVCCYPDGSTVGGEVQLTKIEATSIELRQKYNIEGDISEAYKTSVMKQYPFPEIEGERFCPEALVWFRIASKYKLYFTNDKIYICDYLPDGLSAKITRLRMNNPISSLLCYEIMSEMSILRSVKIRNIINFWRFYFCSSISLCDAIDMIGRLNIVFLPVGYILHIVDKIKH